MSGDFPVGRKTETFDEFFVDNQPICSSVEWRYQAFEVEWMSKCNQANRGSLCHWQFPSMMRCYAREEPGPRSGFPGRTYAIAPPSFSHDCSSASMGANRSFVSVRTKCLMPAGKPWMAYLESDVWYAGLLGTAFPRFRFSCADRTLGEVSPATNMFITKKAALLY